MSEDVAGSGALIRAFPSGERANLAVLDQALAPHIDQRKINLLKHNIRCYLATLSPRVIDPPEHLRTASHVLVVPTATTHDMRGRFDEHGYSREVQAIGFNGRNHLRSFSFKRVPTRDDVKTGKKGREFESNLNDRTDALAEMVNNEIVGRGDRRGKKRKFEDAFQMSFAKEISDISVLVDPQSITAQRNREYFNLMLDLGLLPEGWKSTTYEWNKDGKTTEDTDEQIQIPKEAFDAVIAEIERLDRQQIETQVQIFNTVLNSAALDVMKTTPGQQDTALYRYLEPFARQKLTEEFEDGRKGRKRRSGVVMPETEKADARRALIGTYPLIASITDFNNDAHVNRLDRALGGIAQTFSTDAEVIDEAAGASMNLPQQQKYKVLPHLEGLTERDVSRGVAGRMPFLAPYLLYVHAADMPKDTREWSALLDVANMDAQLVNQKIRRRGRLLTDFAPSEHERADNWADIRGELGPQFLDGMVDYMRCIGYSMFMTTFKRLRDENRIHDIPDRDLPLLCATSEPLHRELASKEAREFMEEDHTMTLAGIFFDRFDTRELLHMGNIFSTHQTGRMGFEKLRRELAGQTAMTHDGESYKFWMLPSMTFAERMESEDLMGIVPEPVNHAGNLQLILDKLGHSMSKADYFDHDIHYVQFYKEHRGQMSVDALVIYEEWRDVGQDKLYLRPTKVFRPDGEYIELDPRGGVAYSTDGSKPLTLMDAVNRYADYVNAKKLDVAPIRPHREALLRQALERPEGINLLSGFETGDTLQSQQAYNTLNDHYGAYVRGRRNDAMAVIPGVWVPPEVVDGTYAAMNYISDRDIKMPAAIARMVRNRDISGGTQFFDHTPE